MTDLSAGILKTNGTFKENYSGYLVCCQKSKGPLQMKLLKQLLLIAPMLCIFIASGCSKNLFQLQDDESLLTEKSAVEEKVEGLDTSSDQYEKPGPGPDFGSAPQGMPGDGATGSFSAAPFVEKKDDHRRNSARKYPCRPTQ